MTENPEQEKLSILLVEDDESASDLLVQTLRRTDFGDSELHVADSVSYTHLTLPTIYSV